MNKVKTVLEDVYFYTLESGDVININVYIIIDHKQEEIYLLMESDNTNNNWEDLIFELGYDIVHKKIKDYIINRVKELDENIGNVHLKNDFKNYYINNPDKHYGYQSINIGF